jgi:hypothetical protein
MASTYLAHLRNGSANGNGQIIGKKGRVLMASTVVGLRLQQRQRRLASIQSPPGWIRGPRDGEFLHVSSIYRLVVSGDTDEARARGTSPALRVEVSFISGEKATLLGDAALALLAACHIELPPLSLAEGNCFGSEDD